MENRIMNLGRIVGMILILTAFSVQIAGAQSVVDDALSLQNLIVAPHPIVAGQNMSIQFQLYNSYTNPLDYVNLQLTSTNPILNFSPSSTYLIDSIGSGEYGGGTSDIFTYNFHVPSTLSAGEYTIDAQATYETSAPGGEDEPGVAIMPISFFVYGIPNIQLTATPQGQISPGSQTEFDITAINTGTDTARNVSVSFIPSRNFTAYGAPTLNFGIMSIGSTDTDTATLQVGRNLTSGVVGIPVLVKYTGESGINYNTTEYIPVSFAPGNPNITVSIASAVPSQLAPGSNQTATILVQNNGNEAKNLSIKFMDSGPLSVSGSAAYYFIGNLQAGTSVTEQVQLVASRSANESTYQLPVLVSYSNQSYGSSTQTTLYIPIKLEDTAIFNITSVSGTLTPGASYVPLVFTIKNIGNEPAQQVSLSLQTVYPITPVDPNFYINELQPGESVNATFYTNIDTKGDNGTYPVTLYEQWRQPNGNTAQQYSSSNNYYANVTVTSLFGSWIIYVVVIVVIAIGGVYYYKKIYNKKKKKA
jgi:hypothetical protein